MIKINKKLFIFYISITAMLFFLGGILTGESTGTPRQLADYEAVSKLDKFPLKTRQVASCMSRYEAEMYKLRYEAIPSAKTFRYSILPVRNRYVLFQHTREFTYRKPTYEGFKKFINE